MALNQTNPNFPSPYINETRADDPIMKRVKTAHAEIGSRPSGMPSDVKNSNTISHVGDKAG